MKLAAALLLCIACGSTAPVNPPAKPSPPRDLAAEAAEAQALFLDLEDRLLHAKHIEIKARLKSTGRFATEFVGRLAIDGGQRLHMDFDGNLDGTPAEVLMIGDGRGLGLNDTGVHESPPALIPALLLGATRMGLLHNVVLTSTDGMPDHSEGEDLLRYWLTVDSFSLGDDETIRGRRARVVKFRLLLDTRPMAEATLWIDAATGEPIQRRQTVHFPEGDMHVTESYGHFVIEP